MNRKQLPFLGTTLVLVVIGLYQAAFAVAVPVDAISGASGGRKMVTISAVDVTLNTGSITFSEGYRNGSLRFYYSTTSFASASDTTRATVTRQTVSTRGSGTHRLTGLQPSTKYYYRFQGYYPRGQNNYWATGSFTTQVSTAVLPKAASSLSVQGPSRDILGRKPSTASGTTLKGNRPTVDIRR